MLQRLIETDHVGRILYATPEAASLLGLNARDMTGRDVVVLFPQHKRHLRDQLRAVVDGRPRTAVEVPVSRGKDKPPAAVFVSVVVLDARRLQWRLVLASEL